MSSELDSEYTEEDQARDRTRRKNREEARLK
jgi:magnesium-transporting ATPase (P-type)